MRLMFVHHVIEDRGSAQDIHNYMHMASALGHEVAVYGRPNAHSSFNYSLDIESANAVIFIFEWTTQLRHGDSLDIVRLMSRVPRERCIIIDCDGNYNDAIAVGGDYNHRDAAESRLWTDICDSLSDRIYQPALHPLRPNVRPFLFHAYDPACERPLSFGNKEYGMLYVGHSKFRWWPMRRVLQALESIRQDIGRIGLVGHGWDAPPPWAVPMQIEDFYYTDPAYLEGLEVEIIPPVTFDKVIPWMSKATFNPVIYRPLFSDLGLVTCRTFETPAANTIPLFGLDVDYVKKIYGDCALELVLPEDRPEEKILDIIRRPEHYEQMVLGIRRHLAKEHSYVMRLRELIEIVES
jgi:hypothetical protein